MPFLRAARIKKNLQPEIERPKVILTPVIEEEQTEPEEEFTPTQIEDLHRLIDTRTEEAELAEQVIPEPEEVIIVVPEIIPEPEIVPEVEMVIVEAESVREIPEEENEPAEPEISEPESEQEAEIESAVNEADSESEIAESETESTQEDSQPEVESAQEISQTDSSQEATAETVAPEIETEPEITESETESSPEISQPDSSQEISAEDIATESEIIVPEAENESDTAECQAESADEIETVTPEPETQEPEQSQEDLPQEPKSNKDYSGAQLNYDFTSGERYVDKVSTKTEFDKMLDELANISKELLSWQTEKFARDYTEKFSEGESSQAEARKYEAFLGGYITNAAMLLYDKGYREAAIKQLKQAISILQARKKLEDETSAIKSRVEENDSVDLSDILGLFGDG